MDISYLGAGCVKINGKQITLVCDPFDESSGLGKLRVNSDVILRTGLESHNSSLSGMVIDGPGEYEVKGALITGVPVRLHIDAEGERGTAYSVKVDGINVVFLGNIAGVLSDNQVEVLGQVDVLIVPIGGRGLTLDTTGAAQVISQLEPKFVVPTHYDDGVTKYPVPQEGIDKFLNEMGVKPEAMPKLKIQSKEMPLETTVVVLERATS